MDFVLGCQTPDGTGWFIDLIQWLEHYDIPSLLISLDTQKAFDRVITGYT